MNPVAPSLGGGQRRAGTSSRSPGAQSPLGGPSTRAATGRLALRAERGKRRMGLPDAERRATTRRPVAKWTCAFVWGYAGSIPARAASDMTPPLGRMRNGLGMSRPAEKGWSFPAAACAPDAAFEAPQRPDNRATTRAASDPSHGGGYSPALTLLADRGAVGVCHRSPHREDYRGSRNGLGSPGASLLELPRRVAPAGAFPGAA